MIKMIKTELDSSESAAIITSLHALTRGVQALMTAEALQEFHILAVFVRVTHLLPALTAAIVLFLFKQIAALSTKRP